MLSETVLAGVEPGEPSIGLEPRFIDMVFEILDDLQHREDETIVMVSHDAKRGPGCAGMGGVLETENVGRLVLGG